MQKKQHESESARNVSVASHAVCIHVMPGICGFTAVISARKLENKKIRFQISDSECGQIKMLAATLQEMDWKDLFVPLTRNPVYVNAEKSGCHPSCVMPAAMLKAAEVAMGMAIPKDVYFRFQPCDGEPIHEN
jgi:hypothetical protein